MTPPGGVAISARDARGIFDQLHAPDSVGTFFQGALDVVVGDADGSLVVGDRGGGAEVQLILAVAHHRGVAAVDRLLPIRMIDDVAVVGELLRERCRVLGEHPLARRINRDRRDRGMSWAAGIRECRRGVYTDQNFDQAASTAARS